MEQIELVIRVPKDRYDKIVANPRCVGCMDAIYDRDWFVKSLQDGIVLPKGHGRLIDGDILKNQNCCSESYVKLFTIVEADKEGAEE